MSVCNYSFVIENASAQLVIQSLFTTQANFASSACVQERLSYIGPEEFVQAFVQKDPLDNDKVMSAFLQKLKE